MVSLFFFMEQPEDGLGTCIAIVFTSEFPSQIFQNNILCDHEVSTTAKTTGSNNNEAELLDVSFLEVKNLINIGCYIQKVIKR